MEKDVDKIPSGLGQLIGKAMGGDKGQVIGDLIEDAIGVKAADSFYSQLAASLQLNLDLNDTGVNEGVGVYGDFNDPNAG